MRLIASLLYWTVTLSLNVIFFLVALLIFILTLPFDRKKVVLHMFSSFWASFYIWINPAWSVAIKGREHIQKGSAYVLVSNHQSMVDILILFSLFKHFKWVSKNAVFRIPFMGWNMTLNDYISIHRTSVKSQQRMLAKIKKTLAKGSSVMMFPEGTRARDGVMQRFKQGAFKMARDAQVEIIPIVLDGSYDAFYNNFIIKKACKFQLHVLPPVERSFIQSHSVKEISDHVADLMDKELKSMREDQAVT